MSTESENGTKNIESAKQANFLIPPFKYYLVISFVLTFFVVALDGIYRSDAFLMRQPFLMIVENGVFLWVLLFTFFLFTGLIFWGGDALTALILNRKKQNQTSEKIKYANFLSSLFYYILFAYINIIYFRLYLSSFVPGMRKDGVILGAVLVTSIAIVVAVILFFVRFRKYLREQIFPVLSVTVFRVILSITVIIYVAAFILYNFAGSSKAIASSGNTAEKGNRPHVILITLDNLRSNNMSLYGYNRRTTPFLESFARESTVFNNMKGTSTETMVSMPCIITGKYPVKKFPFQRSFYSNSLPDILRKNGYEKTIFLSPLSMNMFPRQIFSEYLILNNSKGDPMKAYSYLGKSRKSLLWLSSFMSEDERFFNIFDQRDPRDITFRQTQTIMTEAYEYIVNTLKSSEKPVFIWAHFLETHPPYNPPPALKQHFKGNPDPEYDKYDGCIRYSDYELSNFIGRLKIEGLYDNSLIVISSDHGCYFPSEMAPREIMMQTSPPQAVLRFTNLVTNIPLIIHEPGQRKGARVRSVAVQSDIVPTILELVGLTIPPEIDGESMVPYMRDITVTSKKIKFCLPAQYEYRWNKIAFDETYNSQFEFFNAFFDHYVVELSQMQFTRILRGGKVEKRFSSKLPYICVGVYDLDNDRHRKENLGKLPGSAMTVEKLINSTWFKYYGEIENPDDGR